MDAFKKGASFSTSPKTGTATPRSGAMNAAYGIKGMPPPGATTPPRKDARQEGGLISHLEWS